MTRGVGDNIQTFKCPIWNKYVNFGKTIANDYEADWNAIPFFAIPASWKVRNAKVYPRPGRKIVLSHTARYFHSCNIILPWGALLFRLPC